MRQSAVRRPQLKNTASTKIPEGSSNWYIGLMTVIATGMSLISIYSIIIVLFGMLPGLIAMIVDQEPKRYVSKIVLSFNATGLSVYISKIIAAHESANALAIEFIMQQHTWLTIYSYAAIGYLVY